jgi:hypothetical protein
MTTFPLNPVEYVFTGPRPQPVTFVFFYPARLDTDVLRKGIQEVCHAFPIVRSRLISPSAGTLCFEDSGSAPALVNGESDLPYSPDGDIRTYISPVASDPGKPLVALTVTRTPNGTVLGASFSHALADGFSYFHFLGSWARVCRGEQFIPPALEREPLPLHAREETPAVTPDDVLVECGLFQAGKRVAESFEISAMKRIFLPQEEIKRSVGSHAQGMALTENDFVAAILWKSYLAPLAEVDADEPLYVTCPFDFRRMIQGFPRMYFGCALTFATAHLTLREIREAAVAELAGVVHEAVIRIKRERALRSLLILEHLRRSDGIEALQTIHLHHPRNGMIVTNLTRMPIADLDFGCGAPSAYTAYIDVVRGAAILPGVGGVTVLLGLKRGESLPPDVSRFAVQREREQDSRGSME